MTRPAARVANAADLMENAARLRRFVWSAPATSGRSRG